MTKDEILALIENTISGQGSQVDIGGKLAAVLSNIVNLIPESGGVEPMIVEGTFDSSLSEFSPNTGQPSYQQALEAYESGTPVFLKYQDGDADTVYNSLVSAHIINSGNEETYLKAGSANWLEP